LHPSLCPLGFADGTVPSDDSSTLFPLTASFLIFFVVTAFLCNFFAVTAPFLMSLVPLFDAAYPTPPIDTNSESAR
jgi:hypothetical protein